MGRVIANEVKTRYGTGQLVEVGHYGDGSPALEIHNASGVVCRLTVCLGLGPLGDGEYLIKTWSENSKIAASVLNQGIFEDTGRREPTGHVEASVWKLTTTE